MDDDRGTVPYTPGAWRQSTKSPFHIVTTKRIPYFGREVLAEVFVADVQANGEDDHDARLVAAAPDLLAACHALVDGWYDGSVAQDAVDKARAAIAKAEGRVE